jgi:hypothetical protein
MVLAEIVGCGRKIVRRFEANEKFNGFLGAGNRQQ